MYTPDRTMVPGPSAVSFYRNRGRDDGTINLNRLSGVMMPTGRFCCEVPDALDIMQRVCANIGELVGFLMVTFYCSRLIFDIQVLASMYGSLVVQL